MPDSTDPAVRGRPEAPPAKQRRVETDAGTVACEYVVNSAGMWARQLGALAGVSVPNQAAEHYYLLTEPMSDVGAGWPVVEVRVMRRLHASHRENAARADRQRTHRSQDPSNCTYIRPEGGGLMVGLFE